jgi:hypothetical protein
MFILSLTGIVSNSLNAQQPPCMTDFLGLTYQISYPVDCPPISIYMPLDVLIGYIVMDSISTYGNNDEVMSFINRQTYNDTLRKIMRYWYKTVDYDPVKYQIYSFQGCPHEYVIKNSIESKILNRIKLTSPKKFIDQTLIASYIIAHIRVTDTLKREDETAITAKTAYIVNCIVLDTIKGKVIPACKDLIVNFPAILEKKPDDNLQNVLPGSCLQFEYCIEWPRGGDYNLDMLDSDGKPWIKKDKEYIVFLETRIVCFTDNNIYYTLAPLRLNDSFSGSMYPVNNGFVVDPYNEFGFGTSVPVEEFKDSLRQKINEIINY